MTGPADMLGQEVVARFASHDGVYSFGKVVSYTDRPTYLLERPDGSRFSWLAELCERQDPGITDADRVRSIHQPRTRVGADVTRCREDGQDYPCNTVRALEHE